MNKQCENMMQISKKEASEKLNIPEQMLDYCAWPEVYGNTSGPFGRIGGQTMTTFTIEAWFPAVMPWCFAEIR